MEIQLKTVNILDSLGFKKDALIKLDQLISKDSLNNEYWLKRGQLCKYLEDTVAAIKAFRFAARVYPTPISLMELANLYAETKNIKTISIANQLMKIYPDGKFNAEANFFIAVYYSKMNDAANAIKYFNKSIQENMYFYDAYTEKGYLYYQQHKYQDALAVFSQLVKINQTSVDGYYWQAKCNETLNNKSEAINLYEKALLLDPNLKEAEAAIKRLK